MYSSWVRNSCTFIHRHQCILLYFEMAISTIFYYKKCCKQYYVANFFEATLKIAILKMTFSECPHVFIQQLGQKVMLTKIPHFATTFHILRLFL